MKTTKINNNSNQGEVYLLISMIFLEEKQPSFLTLNRQKTII